MKSIKQKIILIFVMINLVLLLPHAVNATSIPTVKYQVHIQGSGWLSAVSSGKTAGSIGKSARMEAIKITLTSNKKSMIQYRTHVANVGWQGWKTSDQIAGTTGQAKAIEAIQIKLTSTYEKKYDIYYRVHVANKGWLGWAKNGETAGSTGISLRTEAIQIKLVEKGSKIPTEGKASLSKPSLLYRGHVQNIGWQKTVGEGSTAGTTGKAYRLEALQISLKDFDGNNGIFYRAHVSNIGWQDWVSSGKITGTTGKSYAIEAVQIKLSSSLSSFFDIYYRVHSANYGWLGWAKNGENAGTTGGGIRAEAIQIVIVIKNSNFNRNGSAYINVSVRNLIENPSYNISVSNKSKENQPHYFNYIGSRSSDAYNKVIDQFMVESNRRYTRDSNGTYCNIFAWDVMYAMGLENYYSHWFKNNVPVKSSTSKATEYNANATFNWLANYGSSYGWSSVSANYAQSRANAGYPTIAIWKNPSGASGHIMVVRPETLSKKYSSTKGPVIAQAGATNKNYLNVLDAVGSSKFPKVYYYTHN